MASMAEVYVSDARRCAPRSRLHRRRGGVPAAVSGFLIQKELEDAIASRIIDSWQHPVARLDASSDGEQLVLSAL